jgi:predicted transposase/invertase (TIGR01784 family)
MRRDTLFYRIFQQNPTLLFDLLPTPPPNPQSYTFESIEVKETSFRIDGVLVPADPTGLILFSEVQMQPDPLLYERLHSEISIYAYRHQGSFADWQALVIYPSRAIEQTSTNVPRELFESGRIQAVYLDELGDIDQRPLELGLLVLTILEGDTAITEAQSLMTRARRIEAGNAIMEMISTVLIYKFTTLSRDEVNAMLGYTIDELKQTRVYQEAKAEGKQEGIREGIREGRKEGKQEGRQEGERNLVLRLLPRRIGALSPELVAQIGTLSLPQLEALGEALLDFSRPSDLTDWLQSQG